MMNNEDSLYVEQSVLGSLLQLADPDSKAAETVLSILKPKSFYSLLHRNIYQTIKTLQATGEHFDMITVEAKYKTLGFTDENLILTLANLIQVTPSPSNAIGYAKNVREFAIERFATTKLNDILADFADKSNGTVQQRIGLLETTFSEISNLALRDEKKGLKHVSEIALGWIDIVDEIQKDGFDKNKFTTGIESLDDVLGVKGMRRGSLVGVGARPKMGKTALLSLIANHFALDLKETVAIFSMEMPQVEIFERSLSGRMRIDPIKLYSTNASNETRGRLDTACTEFHTSNLYIEDTPALRLSDIQREARNLRREKGSIGLICIDYLTLMEAEKADRNDLAYGMITKGLKNLAKELNCVVILLTQLNRGLENRPDKRPMPSDSRDTGQIEQDVDLWIGLYKDSVYNEGGQHQGLTELIVRLNRHGGTGTGFVEMKEGYHLPLTTVEGTKMENIRSQESNKAEAEQANAYKMGKKAKQLNNKD